MYKVRRTEYKKHIDASKAAEAKSRFIPVFLHAPTGGAWYWRGQYCGMHFWDVLFRKR